MTTIRNKTILMWCGALVVAAVLWRAYGWIEPTAVPPAREIDRLPGQLSDTEFWSLLSNFSEPDGYFRSDNFLSNEAGSQSVIARVRETAKPGGVYMGVGPEQNFTYILALDPRIAFIVDIRRLNMLEHLMYKALMERSADRAEFLSRLFSRPRPSSLNDGSTIETLLDTYFAIEPDPALFQTNLRDILNTLSQTHGFRLSAQDLKDIEYAYRAFYDGGPGLSYVFKGAFGAIGGMGMPTYTDLMVEYDDSHQQHSFLATEEQFRKLRELQRKNLIIPIVGDFAGGKALASIASYIRNHNAVLSCFYLSNVEMYLFQQDDDWKHFYNNVALMPVDSASTFIRFVVGRGYFSGARRSQLAASIPDLVAAFRAGRIRNYGNVIDLSH